MEPCLPPSDKPLSIPPPHGTLNRQHLRPPKPPLPHARSPPTTNTEPPSRPRWSNVLRISRRSRSSSRRSSRSQLQELPVLDVRKPSPTVPTDQPEVSKPALKDSAAVLLESGWPPETERRTPPGVPSRPASSRLQPPTCTSQLVRQWPQPCPRRSLSTSPALRVPRSSPPLPLPSLLQSTCSPELAEPPQRGEPISLLFEAFFDLLTMEY